SAQLIAHVSLDEVARGVDVPIHPQKGLNAVDATVAVNSMQIEKASIELGRTNITASGDLRTNARFQGDFVLDELGRLLGMEQRPTGLVHLSGTAVLPHTGGYLIDGTVQSQNLSYDKFRNVHVGTAFHADPTTASINGLTVATLGGEIRANARVHNFETF